MRVQAVKAVGWYRDDLIAGEVPDLRVRLRAAGFEVWRIDAEMTLHDANIQSFGQWWRRTKRAGFAFSAGAALHGAPPTRHWVRETWRAIVWGMLLPMMIMLGAVFVTPWILFLTLVYLLQWLRLSLRMGWREAGFSVIGKFAEAMGVLEHRRDMLRAKKRSIIEYK